jgi:polyhydroxyalkanoate synthesis regulator phasin
VRDDLRRMAVFTSGIAEMTLNRAEELVRSWASDLRREQAQAMARDLLEWSKHNRKELAAFVRSEVQSQLPALGVATRRDMERLERRVERLEEAVRAAATASASTKKPRRKATGRKKTTASRRARTSGAG